MDGQAPSWFADDASLLAEVRRSSGEGAPRVSIPGYDVLRELHRGGQGVVYEAVQRSTKRRVAIKVLLDSAYYSESGRRRFEREIDVAASLDHPGIVRVFDSGRTDEGRAYLVMQLIEGERLDAYAERLGREPREMARTMIEVCEAVRHAHQRGVIHRDLKPSNILVDSSGRAHVLDFGLAKAAVPDAGSADSMGLTTTGQFVGSLPWASPEQARGAHDQADTRSDVYALGAILYQMLTGRFPCEVSGPLHVALSNIAMVPATPARSVRADLDEQIEIILATCLAKEPDARYQSVAELAEDLRHHLAGEPIVAQRESAWRVLSRRAARYRAALVAGSLALLVFAGLSVWAIGSARGANRARGEALDQRNRADAAATEATKEAAQARLERERAERTLKFISGLLSRANPDAPGGTKDLKVADLLAQGSAEVERAYPSDPLIRAELYRVFGQALSRLGVAAPAIEALERSLAALRDAGVPEVDARVLRARGDALDARLENGGAADLIAPLDQLAKDQAAALGPVNSDLATTLSDLGMALKQVGRLPEAEDAFRRALAAIPEANAELALNTRNNVAGLLSDMHRFDEAEPLYREVIAGAAKTLGEDHLLTMTARNNLGAILMDAGRQEDAVPILEVVLESSRRVRGDDHPGTLVAMLNLGSLQHRLKHLDRANALLSECLERRRRVLGPAHPHTLVTMNNYALLLADLGRFDEAEALAKECLDRRITLNGERHFDVIISLNAYAMTMVKGPDPARAVPVFERIFDLCRPEAGVLPPGSHIPLLMQGNYGRCLLALRRFDEAEQQLLDSYGGLVSKFGPTNDYARRTAGYVADLYDRMERPRDAARFRDLATLPKAP